LWLVSHEVITSGSPPERFEICVSRTYFPSESQRPFRTDRIRPPMTRIRVSRPDWEGTGSPSVGARCPAVTLRLERFLREVLKNVDVLAFGDVIVVTHLTLELEDLGQGRTKPLFVYPERQSDSFPASAKSTGLSSRVDSQLAVQRVGLAIKHRPVVRVVHNTFWRQQPSRRPRSSLSRPPLRLHTGSEGGLHREPKVYTPEELSRSLPASLNPL